MEVIDCAYVRVRQAAQYFLRQRRFRKPFSALLVQESNTRASRVVLHLTKAKTKMNKHQETNMQHRVNTKRCRAVKRALRRQRQEMD
jgi:hypothetical protein